VKRTAAVLFLGASVGLLSQSCGSRDEKKNILPPAGGEGGGAGDGGETTRAGSPAQNPGGQGGAAANPPGGAGGAGGAGDAAGDAGAAGATGTSGDCPSGFDECDGDLGERCEQDLNSVEACGDCETTCTNAHGGTSCENLACKVTSCDTGYDDCNGDPNDGCETNLVNNDAHCGACGRDCSSVGATCAVDSCGDIRMQENVSIGVGNGAWNDRAWAFSSELGIVNMTRAPAVVQWFGLDGISTKVVWNLGTGETGNGTLVIDGEDIYWAQRGTPNVVRKKALGEASATLPTDVFYPEVLPAYLRRQGDSFYWISGEYGEPGYVYRRPFAAASDVPGTRIVDVAQGPGADITGFAVTTDAIYWITGNDLDPGTLDNDIRTTPLTGGVPTSVPKVAGAATGQIKDFGNYTINANLTAVGDTLYFARTIDASTLNGIYRFKKGDAAPTKLVEAEDISTFAVSDAFIYYGLLNQQGVWRAPLAGGQGVKVSQSYLTTVVGTDAKFAYVAFVNQPSYFYKIFH
jgi:hypothetical protein